MGASEQVALAPGLAPHPGPFQKGVIYLTEHWSIPIFDS